MKGTQNCKINNESRCQLNLHRIMTANVDITIVHTWDGLSGKTFPKGETPTFSDSIQDIKNC